MAVIYAFIKGTFKNVHNKLFVRKKYNINHHRRNRHYFSANGPFLLLPLALKWGLFSILALFILPLVYGTDVSAAELNITIPTDPLSVTVSADGTAKESSSASIKVTSDAYWGYTLSVKSNDANGALTNGNSKINSIGTGITSLSQFTNNTWGFKISGEGVTGPNNYRQGPTTSTTNLATTTGKKGGQETGTYLFTLASKVDNTIPAGTYTGTFTFMATANAVNYTINFNMRSGTGGPSTLSGQTENATVKIASSVPTKDNHVFLGWCDQAVSGNGPCNGTIYQPDDNYTLKSANENTTLYALYDGDTVYMQNWKGCTKYLTKNTQFTLTGKRDDRKYYVAKLADDNCWMTENLDLFLDASKPLTPADSDVKTTWTPPTTIKEGEAKTWYAHGAGELGDTHPQSYDFGDKCWQDPQVWVSRQELPYQSSVACAKHDPSHYHVGNYYNYSAAVAQDDTSNLTKDGDSANTSICPAGWQLPSYNGPKSFVGLQSAILSDKDSPDWVSKIALDENGKTQSTIHAAPYYFNFFALWSGSITHLNEGVYRTSAVSSAINSYIFRFSTGGDVSPSAKTWWRNEGDSVRCVSRN